MGINKDKFTDDVVVLPINDHPVRKSLITSKVNVECVLEVTNPKICVVVIKGENYSIALPAQEVCDMIYGGLGI